MFDICVTIVNTKERDEIEKSLQSLYLDTKNSSLNFAVVIVDNDSKENIEELVSKFPNLQIIKNEKNFGFGYSHNQAMKKVMARYYFILNPNTLFPVGQNILKQLVDFMERNPKIGLVGPKILYPDNTLQYSSYRYPSFFQPVYSRTSIGQTQHGKKATDRYLMKDFDHEATIPVDWVMGSAMFYRREAYEKVGGFDERFFMYAEDSDLCRRNWEAGWSVYYLHAVNIIHTHGRASAKVRNPLFAILNNHFTRIHIFSWLKYFIKWRNNRRYYPHKV